MCLFPILFSLLAQIMYFIYIIYCIIFMLRYKVKIAFAQPELSNGTQLLVCVQATLSGVKVLAVV